MTPELIEAQLTVWQREIDHLANDPSRQDEYERGCREIAAAREEFAQARREKMARHV